MSPAKRATTRKRPTDDSAIPQDRDATPPRSELADAVAMPSADDLEHRIRQRAYELYCSRDGGGDGNELEDWLAAEREVQLGHVPTHGQAPLLLDTASEDEHRNVAR